MRPALGCLLAVLALLLWPGPAAAARAARGGKARQRPAAAVHEADRARDLARGPAAEERALGATRAQPRRARVLAAARAFAVGAAESPLHLVRHLARPRSLATAVGVTAGLGIAVHLAGVDLTTIVKPVLISVLSIRWARALPHIRRARGPERFRLIGREAAGTLEVGAELFGVHLLADGGLGVPAGAGDGLGALARAAAAGVVGLHEIFYLDLGGRHGEHSHTAGSHSH
jgi:hypothetical protein